jgi:hypothetical protein
MAKKKIKWTWIFFGECDCFFYSDNWKSKSMYGFCAYEYKYCIPYIVGLRKLETWGGINND